MLGQEVKDTQSRVNLLEKNPLIIDTFLAFNIAADDRGLSYTPIEEISVVSWETAFEQTDPSVAFEEFNTIVADIYNSKCPMKQLRYKRMNPRKPWMDQELLTMISLRNEMYSDYLGFSGDERQKLFIDQRNKTNSLKRKKVKVFYRTKFEEKAGDPKGTWDIINGIIKGERKPQEYSLEVNGKVISDLE
ncbi:hypothetical protein QYM36_011545 [Artemia franciscana]|uniref:Uncharacterized protein n=1 Tax=Artemia franciscana TaxID=6661 RepID=A0AA88HNT2_ARTSF|nr:hypothetical protein QYM36_011545 [Artemia franciscana]